VIFLTKVNGFHKNVNKKMPPVEFCVCMKIKSPVWGSWLCHNSFAGILTALRAGKLVQTESHEVYFNG